MTAASWRTALLGGALLRRRRQATLGLVAVASLCTAQVGCGPEPSMSEGTDSGSPASSTGPVASTGDAPEEVSAQMFGTFHDQADHVGLMISEDPPDEMVWYPWTTLRINRDGSLMLSRNFCQSLVEVQTFTWVHGGDDTLRVVPDEYNSDGTFEWDAVQVTAVTITPGESCGDIETVSEYLPDSGQSPNKRYWSP